MNYLIIASLLLTTSLQAAVFKENRMHVLMAEAVVLMTHDRKDSAYSILEEIFERSENQQDKVDSAMILAYAENKFLKKKKRHFYAHFASSVLPQGADRSAYLRIAGDGFFEEMELPAAIKSYEELVKSANPADQDYGQYKLGWVDLNQKSPNHAFKRWYSQVLSGKNRAQDLRMSMIRDLGRSWAETTPASSEQVTMVNQLKFNEKENKEFVDGVAAGMRRLDEEKEFPLFREQLRQTAYFAQVTPHVLSQGVGMNDHPCSVMNWFGSSENAKSADPELLLPRLNSCNFTLHKKLNDGFKNAPETKNLLSFYEILSLKGLKRWPRAAFFKETNTFTDACEDSVAMIAEEPIESATSGKLKDAMENLIESCRMAVTKTPGEVEKNGAIRSNLILVLNKHAKGGLLAMKEENPLYGLVAYFLKSQSFKQEILNVLLASDSSSVFKTTLLPAQVLESLTAEERTMHGDRLLATYAPQPLIQEDKMSTVWLELLRSRVSDLVAKQQYTQAQALLDRYVPLASFANVLNSAPQAASRRVSLWLLWAIAVPSNTTDYNAKGLEVAQMALKLSATQKIEALALCVKFELINEAWSKWADLRTVPASSADLVSGFIQKLFDQGMKGSVKDTMLKKHDDGVMVLAAVNYVKSKDKKSWNQSLVSKDIAKPAFVKDIEFIEALRKNSAEISASKLKFNARLPKLIESRIQQVHKEVDSLKGRVWSHADLAKEARLVVAKTCLNVAASIDGIVYPSEATAQQVQEWKNQLGQISTTVRGWQKTLLADGGL